MINSELIFPNDKKELRGGIFLLMQNETDPKLTLPSSGIECQLQ